jgi:hypothetical protein
MYVCVEWQKLFELCEILGKAYFEIWHLKNYVMIFVFTRQYAKPKWKWKSNMHWLYMLLSSSMKILAIVLTSYLYGSMVQIWPIYYYMQPYIMVGPNCEKKSHLGSFNTNYIIFRNVKIFKKYFFQNKFFFVKETKTIFKNTLEIF